MASLAVPNFNSTSISRNLALIVSFLYKVRLQLTYSDRQTAIDPETKEEIALFHPQRQTWKEHLAWSEPGRK